MLGRKGAIALALMALTAAGCGGKKEEEVELKGTVTLGVLAPTGRPGELGARAKDLTEGAQMAVAETNAAGGVLGRKLELNVVDDGCDATIAYEAAKAFVSDSPVAGVVGGMCDVSAARAVPVIESSSIPFLITSATSSDLVSQDSTSAYMLNGTTYQQGLSATYWMNYRGAQRLAVLQDETPASKDLARQTIAAVDEVPKLVSLQTVEPGGQDLATIAKATIAAKPNFVLWTGGAAAGGQLAQGVARRRLQGHVHRHRRVRGSGVPGRRRAGRRGRVHHRDRDAAEHAGGRAVERAVRAALPAQAGLRGPAGLRRRADARARDEPVPQHRERQGPQGA